MSKPGKVVLTVLLLAGFGAALFFALRGQKAEQEQKAEAAAIASATELKGLIAVDVEPFFADPRVGEEGLDVEGDQAFQLRG